MKRYLFTSVAAAFAVLFFASPVVAQPSVENVPGTFLIAPKFDIRGNRETRIRLVNSHSMPVNVKLNYVCPGEKNVNQFCAALDRLVEFTPYQTRIINVSDQFPPCERGYMVAYAVSPASPVNQPISFNFLYGSYHLIDGRRHESDNLITIQSPQTQGAAITPNGESFRFDQTDLSPIRRDLMTDFCARGADKGSHLILLDLNIFAGMQNPPAVAFIDFWNEAEEPFSTSHEFVCWAEVALEDIDLNFLEANLGSTHGSMNIEPRPTCPVPGTCPQNNSPHQPGMLGALSEFGPGLRAVRNLHHGTIPYPFVYHSR